MAFARFEKKAYYDYKKTSTVHKALIAKKLKEKDISPKQREENAKIKLFID